MSRPVRPYLWMLSSAASFATMGALSKLLAETSDWRFLVVVRASLMLVFAAAILAATRSPFVFRGTPMLWMRSLVGSLSMLCTYYTLTHLHFSEATTLIKSYPLWVALLTWVVFKERPAATVWIAMIVGVAGVVLVARPHFDEARVAIAVGLLSSICTAVVMLGLNRLAHVDPRTIVMHFAMVSTVTCAAVFALAGSGAPVGAFGSPKTLTMLLAMGLLGTTGQIALTRAFALGDPSMVSVVGLSEMLMSAVFDRILWQRTFGWMTIAGMILVAAPTAWRLATSHRSRGESSGSPATAGASPSP
ncbi:MAG: DMT family transporter, partial [Planctomycetes bacterium]|nr:DMT family transporter [Planctomycetota bacterium]